MMQVRKVGIYLRVSTERQAREAEGSLKSQKQRLELEVQRRNEHSPQRWGEIAKVYVEEGRSGKDTNRPEFQKMVADLRSGIVDTIMVTELSRLSRSVTDFLRFMEQVNSLKADLFVRNMTSTPQAPLVEFSSSY
ncbi:MAG: recombinase family protein [Bdellovibrionales bacterium]|nr:recombinase family protein [Bdellovibrionales bacterium]